jgi:energy-coupling factor transporter ATP-binding protein EcfA2
MSEQPHFLKDLEVREMASLDHGKLAASIVSGIELSSPPFRIALFGPWGSGKSTILKLVQAAFDRRDPETTDAFSRTFWFNAWEHESRANLFHSLMSALVEQLPDGVRYSRKGSAIVGRVLDAARAHGRRFDEDQARPAPPSPTDPAPALGVEANRADMDRFTEMILVAGGKKRDKRLVVFIDDLDKCLPLHALALLESIKLSFGAGSSIVFVCSMDADVLRQVVQFKYGNAEAFFADRYIEKIFEFGFEVPRISTLQVKGLVDELYRRSGLGERGLPADQIAAELNVIESVLSRPGLVMSPRQIKRMFNRFIWFLCLDPATDPGLDLAARGALEPWLAWLAATEYWRELRDYVGLYEETAFRELGNQVTGHPIFPHSNDAAKQAFKSLPDQRAVMDFFRCSISTSGESHLAATQEALREQVMRLFQIDTVLRSFGM